MSTITYIVKVASAKFTIDGATAPKLTFRDGDTYVFDQADASNSGHILQFSATSNNSGSSEYTTGVTKTGTPGNAGAKTTIVTSGSTTDTLYYYSSGGGTYGEEFSNSGFNTSTTYNLLKPIVGEEATSEKWGAMLNHAMDQIDQGIDAAITAQDLDFQGDSGGALSIDLNSETLDIAGGTGIDTTGSGNEVSVAIDATVTTLAGTQTFTGTKTFNSDIKAGTIKANDGTAAITIADSTGVVTIANLTVSGTTVTLNTQTVEVEDNILQLNTTQASPDTATAATSGISVYRGNGVTQASLIFDDADDTWDLTNNLVVAGDLETSTTGKVKQKGAFMQSSTHQALALGY